MLIGLLHLWEMDGFRNTDDLFTDEAECFVASFPLSLVPLEGSDLSRCEERPGFISRSYSCKFITIHNISHSIRFILRPVSNED